jgi:hypothetical protein
MKCEGDLEESDCKADWYVITTHIPAAAGAVRMVEERKTKVLSDRNGKGESQRIVVRIV